MENPPPQKKGLGPLAWLGIGCGGLIVIILVVVVAAGVWLGPKAKQLAEEMQKNPTRAAANITIATGQFEMAKEDDTNKRYTVRQKANGQLTTFYWDAKTGKPQSVQGGFDAVPKETENSTPALPATPQPQ
jgi:hypothetical protein